MHKGKPDKSSFGKENRVILSLRVGKNDAENPGWACSPVVGWNTVPAERGVNSDSVRRAAARVDKNVTFYLAAGFMGRRGSLAVFGVIKRHFINNPSALDTTTVPDKMLGTSRNG